MVSIKDMIDGTSKIRVLTTKDLPPWEHPTVRYQIPAGSRPGEQITIPDAWTPRGRYHGYDVVLILVLSPSPPYTIKSDDIYITKLIRTNGRRKVKSVPIWFPDGDGKEIALNRKVDRYMLLTFEGKGMPCRVNGQCNGMRGVYCVILKPTDKIIKQATDLIPLDRVSTALNFPKGYKSSSISDI